MSDRGRSDLARLALLVGLVLGAGLAVAATTLTPTSGTVFLTTNSNVSVGVSGGPDINMSQPFLNDSAVDIETAAGNMTVVGGGTARVTVAKTDIEGTWTNLTALDVDQAGIKVAPADKPAINVSGDADTLDFRAVTDADDGVADFVYSGASGTTTVTLRTAPANTQLAAVDQNNKVLAVATSDGSGAVTFSGMSNSAHTVRLATNSGGPAAANLAPDGATIRYSNETLSVDVTDPDMPDDTVTVEFYLDNTKVATKSTSANATVTHQVTGLSEGQHTWHVVLTDAYGSSTTSSDASFTVDHYEPTVSNPSPNGKLDAEPTELNVTVADGDFPLDGDSVDVDFSLDGSSVGSTQTLTGNGSATVSLPSRGKTGGQHTVTVTATDQYSQTATTSYTYSVPANLTIRNETAPSQLVTNAQVTVRFFADDQVIERSTNTGRINLDGLPVSQPMTVLVEADGYYTRASYIESIYSQQRVYLLNKSLATGYNLVFSLNDKTGNFAPASTTLRIQKPVTRDFDNDNQDETRYETVSGDVFGAANEFATVLQQGRYRLIIENAKGDQRRLGPYTVTGDDAVSLTVGELTFDGQDVDGGRVLNAGLLERSGTRYVELQYADLEDKTSSLRYKIVRTGTGTELVNTTATGPFGRFKATAQVPTSAPDDVSYEVVVIGTTTSGDTVTKRTFVGDVPEIARNLGLDPTVLAYLSYVAIAAITGLVVVFDDRLAALTGTVTATGLTMLGAVSIPPVALGIAGVISILFNVGRVT